jgi:hypothetical protein
MGYLAERVNASIRAARTEDLYGLTGDSAGRFLEASLHGLQSWLPLPAVEGQPVVGDYQPDVAVAT